MTGTATVDLNADLGEGFGVWRLGDDEALLGIVSSANIACGFHAGDPTRLLEVCRMAAGRGVRIGAQVSYRDLVGFGRRYIDIAAADLTADVIYQIGALQALAQAAGSTVSYVKPHGALYNTIVTDPSQAGAVVAAVRAVDANLPVLGLPGSVFLTAAAEAGLTPVCEVFADRAYRADGALVPRNQPGAVLHDPAQVAARVSRMVRTRTVRSADGPEVVVTPESVCVHGDSPSAVEIATAVRRRLRDDDVEIRPFC